ncbi:hypothetical protein ACFROC_02880 [Nocardia tengchongensis]|uniref:hypothetical protein n=1 Tax=Nocardia tengchongensis TaxID=2055889 RepID=UPI0036C5A491
MDHPGQQQGLVYVVRPPFSEIPVYYRVDPDIVTWWAGTALPGDLSTTAWVLNWEYLHSSMINVTWVTPQTGFVDVFELLAGAILDCRDRNLLDRQELTHLADGRVPDGDTKFALIRATLTNEWITRALAPL